MSARPATPTPDNSDPATELPDGPANGNDPVTDPAAMGADAPRPASPEEIVKMLREAETNAEDNTREKSNESALQLIMLIVLWMGVGVAASAAVYVMMKSDSNLGLVAAGMVSVLVAGFITAGAFGLFSPALVAGAALRRAGGVERDEAVGLAGREILQSHSIAEKVLDCDGEPRLITKRDGVVVYANRAYFRLAEEAGLIGSTGLPPRIDRLFSQHGPAAGKIFRLYKAAKSGAESEEMLDQVFGFASDGGRRRYAVMTHPIEGAEDYVAWRLRNVPVEDEEHDMLSAAYADYIRPVFAVERNGQVAWTNAAMRQSLGVERGQLRVLDDIVLGETGDICHTLWQIDQQPVEAMVRRQSGEPRHGVFTAFRRGGVGEGFVCVELNLEEETDEEDAPSLSGDLSEAPFGVANLEGDLGRDAKIAEANKAFLEAFPGAKKGVALGRFLPDAAIDEIAAEARRKSGSVLRTVDATIGEGSDAKTHALFARPIRRKRGGYGTRKAFLYTVDVTDRKRMEDDYTQDQKLKAIGFIAGEVAHDFNNLLQVVLSSSEDLMRRHPAGDPAYEDLVLIRQNAQRAANLTKQLLAYSRKQTLTSKVQSITDLLMDFSRFLDRAVGEKVKLKVLNGRALPPVKVDSNQLETAIMNLAVNARDAMAPDGGLLTISTQLVAASDIAALERSDLGEGDHVLIEVTDTGAGIPPEIAAKIFDPFFTTKEEGKGTGLGLSTVHGIIGQMGGAISVENRDEGGAVFRIYLPAHDGEIEEEEAPVSAPIPAASSYTGGGRILVVEDEDAVRLVVVKTLEQAGYDVEIADDGVEALEVLTDDKDFDLVVTDVMMPEVDGPTMIARAREELNLTSAVLFMSGYAETAIRTQLDKVDKAHYLQKPFARVDLTDRVRNALAERAEEEDAA